MIERQKPGSEDDAERGERLGEASAAELARDHRGEHDESRPGQRGEQADGGKRIAEERHLDAPDERDHGRHIDVAPGQVARESEVV